MLIEIILEMVNIRHHKKLGIFTTNCKYGGHGDIIILPSDVDVKLIGTRFVTDGRLYSTRKLPRNNRCQLSDIEQYGRDAPSILYRHPVRTMKWSCTPIVRGYDLNHTNVKKYYSQLSRIEDVVIRPDGKLDLYFYGSGGRLMSMTKIKLGYKSKILRVFAHGSNLAMLFEDGGISVNGLRNSVVIPGMKLDMIKISLGRIKAYRPKGDEIPIKMGISSKCFLLYADGLYMLDYISGNLIPLDFLDHSCMATVANMSDEVLSFTPVIKSAHSCTDEQ